MRWEGRGNVFINRTDNAQRLQSTLSKTDTLLGPEVSLHPSSRESNKGRNERQGPTLGVHLRRCLSHRGVR